jgi:hypothetical protein
VLQPAFYAALLGLTVLWFRRGAKSVALFATGWLAVSMLAVMPGWHFRPHYYIMLIPAVALLTGALVHQTTTWLARSRRIFLAAMPAVCFAAMLAWAVLAEREFFFHMDPVAACRSLYDSQPFPEARELGGFIRAHCPPAARIAVLGSEPEIYFYARRRAATGFVYTYPLLEGQPFAEQMRARMREEIAAAQPQFIVKASSWNSWLSRPAGPEKVDQLCATLLPPNYRLIAACDFLPEESRVVWHWSPEELTSRRPLAQGLLLFQRVASAEASAPQPGESPSDHAP